ncbi:hypothetical protein CCR75_006340 [Bremia lactucae]|uniref:Uncharacterized protein n=1 Tax=Bremia lactucae TaxID=4779 RepID=A0A976FRE0_BRELC|nr:hypothetical protein CCR75_006340 [Bremia lactucae]
MELNALPPLSPTMEQAFYEAFADMSDLENRNNVSFFKQKPPNNALQSKDVAPALTPHLAPRKRAELPLCQLSPRLLKCHSITTNSELKRARRSAIEKKSRQRRNEHLRRMRDQVRKLETIIRQGFQGYPSCTPNDAIIPLQHPARLVATLQVDHTRLVCALQHRTAATRRVVRADNKYVWNSGVPWSSSFLAAFRHLSVPECYALVRASYDTIQRFSTTQHYETTGVNFMGWTDKRKYDAHTRCLQYGFTKKFWHADPQMLLEKTWAIFMDGYKLEKVAFDASVSNRYEVLQQMKDDWRIVRRDHWIPRIAMTLASVQLIFRLQTHTGYLLGLRTIAVPEIQEALEPHEYFYETFHWTHFNQLYDENDQPAGCEVICAGKIQDQKRLKSTYWLFELVCYIIRWETECIASLFLKHK